MKNLRFQLILIITLLALIFPLRSYAGKPTLYKPKYAKLILSEDGSKSFVFAIDTNSKENNDYKTLYAGKKFDGSFDEIKKTSGRTKYQSSILKNVRFSSIKLPPIFNKKAEHETKIDVEHWCNQAKIWARGKDKRKRDERKRKMSGSYGDSSPQRSLYATVHYKIRQGNKRWDYHIRRAVDTSTDINFAPKCDFREKPQLQLELIPSKKSKSKRGVAVYILYAGSSSSSSTFADNKIMWEEGNEKPEVNIVIKKNDGTRINNFKVPLDKLYFKWLGYLDEKKKAKTEKANYFVRVPDGGGTIEVTLDAGPMFGILKTSKPLE